MPVPNGFADPSPRGDESPPRRSLPEGPEEGREAEGQVGRPEVEEEAITRDRIQVHCHKGVNLVRETMEAGRKRVRALVEGGEGCFDKPPSL